MTAGVTCGSCGTELRATAKFCDNCGTATANSAQTAKYKQVTVLFADVVQSMDMAARIDIERLREIMIELVTRLAAVIRRYGGTVEYNGDGVMALFGAPAALEDHASRACLAGLAVQQEAGRLAAEVQRRDGVALQLRVGLNSGRVIAGELGSGSLGYAATGETVGFAQRMEAAAPPGGVMLSESTALLVEHTARLAEPEFVHIKGVEEPAPSRRLLAIASPDGVVGRAEAGLVGRRWEMAALDAIVDRAIGGRGAIVNVVGPPGIGKSRVAREAAAVAAERGFEVFWTFCESHARDVPFSAVTRLLRAGSGITDLDDADARVRLRDFVPPDADPQDLRLLDDLLGIADPELPLPQVDPDARRRRLTALINSATMARTEPALFIIEDAHWIDAVSESLLAEFLTVVVRTPTVVLITARPEYGGTLARVRGGQAIALAPLSDADIASLIDELLGSDLSVGQLASLIVDRADGNPFFAEEMVRELVQRGVLTGDHGGYRCGTNVAEISVPATVQAAIEARIDRLSGPARRTVDAASVIGARFGAELISALGVDPVIDDLLSAELIDQVRFTPHAEYAFRHPLIRAVAYESQLKSDRAEWHRLLAAAIQERAPEYVEENSALIAEHLRAAGDLPASYAWHMRAGGWSMNRDLDSARLSWERARQIADELPDDLPGHLQMRIAPRTMLCATSWREVESSRHQFADLKMLCAAAGDKLSVAIGMTALASELLYAGRSAEGAVLAREQLTLLDSIGDPAPAMALAYVPFCICFDCGEFAEILDRSQIIVDAAAGDPVMGASFGIGSPLAVALAWRSTARLALGIPGWRADLDDAVAIARDVDATTFAAVVTWSNSAIHYGMISVDDSALTVMEDALESARAHSNETIVGVAMYSLAGALLRCDDDEERQRGVELMKKTRDLCERERALFLVPVADAWIARENARRGDRDAAILVLRASSDELYLAGRPAYGALCTEFLVQTLLERGATDDLDEARSLIDRLETTRPDRNWVIRDAIALRLRALLADARGDQVAFRDSVNRYRAIARSLGCEEEHADSAQSIVSGGT
ncbi:AAA family ATPase [Mycolicibacterium arseniciresistens]|uniref:Adenylate/guanylate cyclase domain-containing protein n=1 Tax=Mycolicibacterium arseniciresistens TaxID=3062257 RepID=A0ABT8UPG9_9MYCO|nr:adenylate/guanylate cyclase domain-containing protein [Mycolicibacterium arseniciresistens]MDO3639695.1 adenylate/guanylate cyclase domain-containing protein [Mycolicibacterium arseniciresistens]